MFADFAGFTALIKEEGAQKGISYLNQLFDTFDDIANYYGLERIKTIGDAYMAVAGVNRKIDHPELATVLTALSIRSFLKAFNERISIDRWKLRVGIHSGPVIAGIVGHQKIADDVWGNTVNISSRLENICRVEAITISKNVQEKTADALNVSDRGEHELHNWGKMNVFEVDGIGDNIPLELKEKYEALDIQKFVDNQFNEPSSILNQLFDIS
jgi:class 3 adenylate cyclase